MREFNWTCPYCSHPQTVVGKKVSLNVGKIDIGECADGDNIGYSIFSIGCSNPACKNVTVNFNYGKIRSSGSHYELYETIAQTKIRPDSAARPFPSYIPQSITQDYIESCRIVDLSPKASATLARRCLQGMIRDFCEISKPTLHAEIMELKRQFESDTAPRGVSDESFAAIEVIRKVGNIGAHMEKDINTIIEVDADEAKLLIGLIETLLDDWYIARHKRQERLDKVSQILLSKEAARASPQAANTDTTS